MYAGNSSAADLLMSGEFPNNAASVDEFDLPVLESEMSPRFFCVGLKPLFEDGVTM
jgi:hypothetical protein